MVNHPDIPAEQGIAPAATIPEPPVVIVRQRRRIWPGVLAVALIAAGLTALAVSSYYDERSVGQRLDASVDAAQRQVDGQVAALKSGAAEASTRGVERTGRVVAALSDTGITAAVKAALATDPSLSALRIEVTTVEGVVTLAGPAPDEKSRQRATVLATAPDGVRSVDNRLVVKVPGAPQT